MGTCGKYMWEGVQSFHALSPDFHMVTNLEALEKQFQWHVVGFTAGNAPGWQEYRKEYGIWGNRKLCKSQLCPYWLSHLELSWEPLRGDL